MHEHYGHRQRLIEKLNGDLLQDHELLEILLFNALSRKNTNDLAHRLISEFGSLSAVLAASVDELCRVKGVGRSIAAYISVNGKILERTTSRNFGYQGEFEAKKFLSYVNVSYAKERAELIDVYLLDETNRVMYRRRFTREATGAVEFSPEELTRLFVRHEPAGVVLVHNHPCGEPIASAADDDTTRKCQMLCSFHNVMLCDHFIYAPRGVYSYYLSGKLQEISEGFSMEKLLKTATQNT